MTRIEKLSLLLLIPSASILATFISPELGLIKIYFFLSNYQISHVMTYYLAGYLLGQGVWGYFSNIKGRSSCMRLGAFIAVIGSLALLYSYYTHNFNFFLLSRTIIGFGLSSSLVCGFTIIKENFPKEVQKKFITLVTIFFTTAIYASIALSGNILKYTSMDIIIWAFLLITSCFFILSLMIKTPINLPITQATNSNYTITLKEIAPTIIYSLVLSITTIIAYLYAFYTPFITSHLFSLSTQLFSTYSFFNLFFILLGSYFFSYLNKYFSEHSICLYGLILIILTNLALIVVYSSSQSSIIFFFFCCYLMNFLTGIIYPAATCNALEYGNCKATASAIMNTIKLLLPIVAIYFSTMLFDNKLNGFSMSIIIFASIFSGVLISSKAFLKIKKSNQHCLT